MNGGKFSDEYLKGFRAAVSSGLPLPSPGNPSLAMDAALKRRPAISNMAAGAISHLAFNLPINASELLPLFDGVTLKTWREKRPGIVKGLSGLLKDRLAHDSATPDDVVTRLIDMLDGGERGVEFLDQPISEQEVKSMTRSMRSHDEAGHQPGREQHAQLLKRCKERLAPEDFQHLTHLIKQVAGARDAQDPLSLERGLKTGEKAFTSVAKGLMRAGGDRKDDDDDDGLSSVLSLLPEMAMEGDQEQQNRWDTDPAEQQWGAKVELSPGELAATIKNFCDPLLEPEDRHQLEQMLAELIPTAEMVGDAPPAFSGRPQVGGGQDPITAASRPARDGLGFSRHGQGGRDRRAMDEMFAASNHIQPSPYPASAELEQQQRLIRNKQVQQQQSWLRGKPRRSPTPAVAMDQASEDRFNAMFPDRARIGHV